MKEFDYNEAMAELEAIEKKVSDASTPLGEIDCLLKRSAELVDQCRGYLRTMRDKFEDNAQDL